MGGRRVGNRLRKEPYPLLTCKSVYINGVCVCVYMGIYISLDKIGSFLPTSKLPPS